MEENSDAGKAKKRIKEKRELDAKTANKKFLIKYIIFVVIIILITIGAIYYSINQLNKNDEENVTEEKTEIAKTTAKDQKYAQSNRNYDKSKKTCIERIFIHYKI